MALAFGEKTVSKAYLGEKAVSAIYLGTKKVFPDEELPGTGDIRLRIETTSANQGFLLFRRITTEEGGFVSVDWGDGNAETLKGATEYEPWHTYATAGEYVVKLTGSKFVEVDGGLAGSYFGDAVREILSLKMPTDSTGVSLRDAFMECYYLTGNIPAWDDCITDADNTYAFCIRLTGNIPAWGANITSAASTYYNCTGLTGCSEELLQDPMPSRITSHADCVSDCADEIRKHFTPDWGGTKEEMDALEGGASA